jgi:hypothetical protein
MRACPYQVLLSRRWCGCWPICYHHLGGCSQALAAAASCLHPGLAFLPGPRT